jgi:hypothetical protein
MSIIGGIIRIARDTPPGPTESPTGWKDDDGGPVEDVPAVDGGGDLRRLVRRFHEAPDHLVGGLQDHRVDVDEGDLPLALRPLLDPVDDDPLGETGAARAHEDHLLSGGLRRVAGDRDVS